MAYFCVLVYCFLLIIRPQDWVPSVLNWPLEFIFLGVALSLGGLAYLGRQDRGTVQPSVPHIPLLFCWVAVVFLSNLANFQLPDVTTYGIMYGKMALIAVACWLTVTSYGRMRLMFVALVIITASLGIHAIEQKMHGVGWGGVTLGWGERVRWVGLWNGMNVLSLVFISVIPFVLELFFGQWGRLMKLLALVSAGLIGVGLVFAASRGAWVSLPVVLLLYFKRRFGRRGVILGVLFSLALVGAAPGRLLHGDATDQKSSDERVESWSNGFTAFKGHPVFGVGKGHYQDYSRLIAHNTFVQNMAETGIVGLYFWIGMVYAAFKGLRVIRSETDPAEVPLIRMAEAVETSLVGYLCASMFITTDFDLLYLILGMAYAAVVVARRETGQELAVDFGYRDFRNIGVATVGAIVMMYAATATLSGG